MDGCFGLYAENGQIVGFIAVAKDFFRANSYNHYVISRLVILPDYQGVGLGTRFIEFVARRCREENKLISIVTSAKNLIFALKKKQWAKLVRFSAMNPKNDPKVKRRSVPTATFKFDFKD